VWVGAWLGTWKIGFILGEYFYAHEIEDGGGAIDFALSVINPKILTLAITLNGKYLGFDISLEYNL
jgi:hypothetical protein